MRSTNRHLPSHPGRLKVQKRTHLVSSQIRTSSPSVCISSVLLVHRSAYHYPAFQKLFGVNVLFGSHDQYERIGKRFQRPKRTGYGDVYGIELLKPIEVSLSFLITPGSVLKYFSTLKVFIRKKRQRYAMNDMLDITSLIRRTDSSQNHEEIRIR